MVNDICSFWSGTSWVLQLQWGQPLKNCLLQDWRDMRTKHGVLRSSSGRSGHLQMFKDAFLGLGFQFKRANNNRQGPCYPGIGLPASKNTSLACHRFPNVIYQAVSKCCVKKHLCFFWIQYDASVELVCLCVLCVLWFSWYAGLIRTCHLIFPAMSESNIPHHLNIPSSTANGQLIQVYTFHSNPQRQPRVSHCT